MESLSGPLHSRKLSNGNGSFSSKNAYGGVLFSGGQRKFGGPTFSAARAEDYREIFGSSTHGVSSIPVLDLSDFDDSSSSVRSSKPDYSKIFSGFKDDDVAVSHEELFGGVKGVKSSPEKKIRTPSATRQPSQDSEELFDTSNQPVDVIKQFMMSYHKTTQRSNDGSNGTAHVAQLRDVPGFTCFIDEIKMAPEQKMEAQSQKGSATNIVFPNVDCNEGISEVQNSKNSMLDMGNERTSGSAVKSKSKYTRAGSFFDEKLFNVHEINLRSHPSKLPPPSRGATSLDSHPTPSNGPTASKSRGSKIKVQESARGDLSPPSSDEELDINSAAAASAAALRKAIEKAQESIRIAKESVGRKKEGLQSFSNRSFKDSLKVKGITDNVEACEKVGGTSEAFTRMERKDAFRDGEVYPGFKNGEKLFVARKVIGEIHEKISESARKSEMSNWYVPELKQSDNFPMVKEVSGEMNRKNLDSAEKCDAATWVSDHVNMEMGRTQGLAFEQAGSKNNFLESADKYESRVKEIRTTNVALEEECVMKAEAVEKTCELEGMERKQNVEEDRLKSACVDEEKENGLAGSEQEEEANREEPRGFYKLVNFVKNLRGFGDKMEEDKKVFDKLKGSDYEVRLNGSLELVDENEMDFQEMMGNDQKEPQGSQKQSEIEKQQQKVFEEEYEGDAENVNELGRNCNHEVDDQWVETGLKEADASKERKQEDFHQGEAVEKWLDEVQELAINEKTQTYVHELDESDDRMQNEFKVERNDDQEGENTEKRLEESDANSEKESEETLKQKCGWGEGNHDKVAEEYMYEERESILGEARESIPSEAGGNQENVKIEIPLEVFCEEFFERDCDTFSHDARSIAAESLDACKIVIEINDNSCTPGVTEAFCEFKEEKAEAIAVTNKVQEKEILVAADEIAAEDKDSEFEVIEVHEDFSPYPNVVELSVADTEVGENEIGQSDEQSDSADGIDMVSNESTQIEEIINQEKTAFFEEQVKYTPERADIQEEEKTVEIKDELQRSQYRERKEGSLNKTTDGRKAKENEPRKEEEKKHLREVDEATKRRWERERDKIAVERAIREARERAFAEARERAKRAAVEKATAEVRQRVMPEAREKIEKVAAAAKSSSEKASVEAKLRAERAAVERATAEARERALEKAMSQKMTTSRSQSERFVADKFSGASRDHGNRQSSSSSDLHGSNGTNAESAERSKARLETHNRILERAAKALAEKEKRDHLAQKEEAERNRLADTLDADIKRWSSGKEGNLRALLSTLQYILGTESGWQPVSLMEIITTSAVKKAYRKATLCVHPDKLQQRGASIQQKYICDKVFDLLKAAWNRFNSEER